jgi:hypothetical protein
MHDAHMARFDVAVVVSNDSDLLEPFKIVRGQLGKKVGLGRRGDKGGYACGAERQCDQEIRLNFTLDLMRAITFVTFLSKSGTVSWPQFRHAPRRSDGRPGLTDQALFPAWEASGTNHPTASS